MSQGRTPSAGSGGEPSHLASSWQLPAWLGLWPHHSHRWPVATGPLPPCPCLLLSVLLPGPLSLALGLPQRVQGVCLKALKLAGSASFSKAAHMTGPGVRKRTYLSGEGGHPPLTPPQSSKHLNAKSERPAFGSRLALRKPPLDPLFNDGCPGGLVTHCPSHPGGEGRVCGGSQGRTSRSRRSNKSLDPPLGFHTLPSATSASQPFWKMIKGITDINSGAKPLLTLSPPAPPLCSPVRHP